MQIARYRKWRHKSLKEMGEITEYKCVSVVQTRYAEMVITR